MKKTMLAALLTLLAQSVWAGVQYDFVQNTQSDIEQIPPTHLTGRAVIDGDRSRVDFVGGNIYAPGAYVVSTNGSRTLAFVDPVSKSYSLINAAAIANAYGSQNVTVTNLKTHLETLPDKPVIAGVPASHYMLTITYEMTVRYGPLPLQQSVREDIEKWTTTRFGDVVTNFFAGGSIRTGNAELDKVIDAETTLIKGFPLRQKTLITTTNPRGTLPGTNIPLNNIRTQQSELQIQSIKPISAADSLFEIPASYQRVENAQQANLNRGPKMTVLSFDGDKPQESPQENPQ